MRHDRVTSLPCLGVIVVLTTLPASSVYSAKVSGPMRTCLPVVSTGGSLPGIGVKGAAVCVPNT